jgi:hypothetical protein
MLEQIGGECTGAVTLIPEGEALPERNVQLQHALYAGTQRATAP